MKKRKKTGKEQFENALVELIKGEWRRRKVAKWFVLSQTVRIVNSLRDDQRYEWSFQEKQ